MDQTAATEVLLRFASVIRVVAEKTAQTFPTVTEVEDAEQDARLLVLSYAGFVPDGRHAGRLADIERVTEGDEGRIMGLMSTQLRMDLNQQYGRELEKTIHSVPLDTLTEAYLPPVFDTLDEVQTDADFPRRYPMLALWITEDKTESQIAEEAGVAERTVRRRIAKEKWDFLARYARRGGLRVEGDETIAELQEACANLRAVGR